MKADKIYINETDEEPIIEDYDENVMALDVELFEGKVDTSYGVSHVLMGGNREGKPVLVFHGENMTSASVLREYSFLFEKFFVYAVDIIGLPGKSDKIRLNADDYEYGCWVREIMQKLKLNKAYAFGISFGAGIILKAIAVSPTKFPAVVLINPAGIAEPVREKRDIALMGKIRYFKSDEYLDDYLKQMYTDIGQINDFEIKTAKEHLKYMAHRPNFPTVVSQNDVKRFKGRILTMASDSDTFFPSRAVLPAARRLFNKGITHTLKLRGHMTFLTDKEKKTVQNFFLREETGE